MGGQPSGEEEAQIEAFQAELEANVDALHDHKSGNLKVHFLQQKTLWVAAAPEQCKLGALHEPKGGSACTASGGVGGARGGCMLPTTPPCF